MEKEININGILYKRVEEEPKSEFKVGDWVEYLLKTSIFQDDEIRIGRITDHNNCLFIIDNKITVQDNHIGRKLTPSEIEAHLIAEAKRRGFKEGIKAASLIDGVIYSMHYDNLYYNSDEDYLYSNFTIYKQGEWAEIIKDESIKIGGYEVEFKRGEIKVGCKTIPNKYVYTIKETFELDRILGSNTDCTLMYDDKQEVDVSEELIDKIIKNLKD